MSSVVKVVKKKVKKVKRVVKEEEPLDEALDDFGDSFSKQVTTAWTCFSHMEGEEACETESVLVRFTSPIKEPQNWAAELPTGAKEFRITVKNGMVQYPALLLKNETGEYDSVALYFSKKDAEPLLY